MLYYRELTDLMRSFTNKLMDDESRELYDARLEYYFKRDEDLVQERIFNIAKGYSDTFRCWGLDSYYNRHPENVNLPLIVFGAGNMGRQTIRALRLLDKKIELVVDNSKELKGKEIYGYKIHSPEIISESNGIVVVAVDRLLQIEIYYQLLSLGIDETKIIMHQEGGLYLDFGTQYFDVKDVSPSPDGEIFVDAGCFDGKTSFNASEWANGNLNKIYAFEPDVNSLENCDAKLQSIGCEYELHNFATWDKETMLSFDVHMNAGYGSKVSEFGASYVKANSIDNIVQGRPVTYIKLDVEGSELKTLEGAISTIKKWRPKLAISIYHKPEDILELPAFVEKLGLNYKYYIRQYQTRIYETTLYAV